MRLACRHSPQNKPTVEPQYSCWCLEDFPKILSRIHIFHQNKTQSAAFSGTFQAAARMEDVTKQNFSFGSLVHYDCVKPRRSNRGKGFQVFSICSTEFSIAQGSGESHGYHRLSGRYQGHLLARCLSTSRWEINGSCREVPRWAPGSPKNAGHPKIVIEIY